MWGKKKVLVAGLVILAVAVVGLAVGVVVLLNENNPEKIAADSISDNVSASEFSEAIEYRFNNELGYSVNDAVNDYETEMNTGNDFYRVYVAIYYANFIYDVNDDIDDAVVILRRVEPLINSGVAVDYYVAFRQLYESAGMSEESEFYNQKVLELIPQDTRPIEEITEGVEAQE